MKILITSYWYKPAINGVVTSVCNLEDELIKQGHEVKILTLSPDKHSYKQDNVYYIGALSLERFNPYIRVPIKSTSQYFDELVAWSPDIIHSQCELFTFAISVRLSMQSMAPLVHTYHTVYAEYTHYFSPSKTVGENIVAQFSRKVLAKVDAVIAPTDKTKHILERYDIDSAIHTIPTGIDMTQFNAPLNHSAIQSLRTQYGLSIDDKVLISVGRIAKEKNLDEIIESFAVFRDSNIKLLLVGDGPHRKSLEEKVSEMNLEKQVIFTGMVSPNNVRLYYELGDIFVCASNSETQGLTYIEALACGLPVICKADECLRDVIYPLKNGYIFHTQADFIAAVNTLFRNPTQYLRLSKYAKETAKRFSKEQFAHSIVELYQHVIETKTPRQICM